MRIEQEEKKLSDRIRRLEQMYERKPQDPGEEVEPLIYYGYQEKFGMPMLNNYLFGLPITPTEDCTLESVSVYIKQKYPDRPNTAVGLYSDLPNPITLIVYSEVWLLTDYFDNWKKFDFPTKPQLTGGVTYHIIFWSGEPLVYLYHEILINASKYSDGGYPYGIPSSFTALFFNTKISMYATCSSLS